LNSIFSSSEAEEIDTESTNTEESVQESSIEEIEEEKNRTGNDRLWLCGRYVGEIADRKDGRLGKSFNIYVGIAEHRSPAMEQARITHRQKLEREKQYQLASRRAEIEAERASIAERQSRLAEMEAEAKSFSAEVPVIGDEEKTEE